MIQIQYAILLIPPSYLHARLLYETSKRQSKSILNFEIAIVPQHPRNNIFRHILKRRILESSEYGSPIQRFQIDQTSEMTTPREVQSHF